MKRLFPWLSAPIIITVIFGTLYVSVQQNLRSSANDPQIQLAENAATQLNSGVSPQEVATGKVNMATSLAPFIIIYDQFGKAVTGSGYLNGQVPTISYGVLTHATAIHDNVLTWEPYPWVRIASVTVRTPKYYVLSGRSLREVEIREGAVLHITILGWLVSEAVLAMCWYVTENPKYLSMRL